MNLRQTLIADFQTPKLVQPSQSALYHPACFAQAAAVRRQFSRDEAANAACSKHLAMCSRVVGPVTLDALRPTAWAPWFTAHERNAIN